ncbi:MAG: AraC family ligand binding domain-containing protein, partial [Undibacterium sp.]|nr:AraC family ligand binding domain-containing protein [Opitutaceae bacterium]
MPRSDPDYFRYFAPAPEQSAWGLALTAAGFTRIARHSDYPPASHPSDHQFSWAHGRVLEALQIVLITAGRGQLELRGAKPRVVEAGMAFILLPKVWHRYRPDPETGWTESWLEAQGPVVAALLARGVFAPGDVLRGGAPAAGLDVALESVHALARPAGPGFDPELAARTY